MRRIFPPFALKKPIVGGERSHGGDDDGSVDKKVEETEECDTFEDAQESLTPPAPLRRLPQHQEVSAQSGPVRGEGCPSEESDVDEQLDQTDEHDVFEDAHENLSSPPPSVRSPQGQEGLTYFDPFGGDDCLSDSGSDDDGGVDEQNNKTDQHDSVECTQEGVSSAHHQFGLSSQPEEPEETDQCGASESDSRLPKRSSQQQAFARYDLFDVDDGPKKTEQTDSPESAQATLSSPARPRHSSVSSYDWMMPVSEK